MGCVNTKFSPSRDEKRKHDLGYGSQSRAAPHRSRSYNNQSSLSDNKLQHRISTSRTAGNGGGGGGAVTEEARGERVVAGAEKHEDGNVSKRFVDKKIGKDVYAGAWPKWLVDNIPAHVLAVLVPKSADCYEMLAKVGRGTYSNVYKAREKATGKIFAMKKVRFDTSDSESIKFMAREIMILQKLDHPNVIKLEGIATSRMQYSLYLVFDYMQSDLTRVITRPGDKLTEPQIKRYMHQLLSGLQHCHERGVMHRDIKASNLLIDKKGELKVADFGLANSFDLKPKGPFTNRVVTLWYRAPELLLGSTNYGFAIDLWSAGCLLAEMFFGKPIMPGRTEVEQLHMIFKLCGSPTEDYWKKLKLMTSYRPPNYKPNYDESFRDFPPSCIDLLTTLLDLDPNYRATAASALQSEFFKTSPLPCPLSALPVIYKDEDERSHIRGRRKKPYKKGQINVTQSGKNKVPAGEDVRNSEWSKEEKNVAGSMSGLEARYSVSSISSNSIQYTTEGSLNTSLTLSPVFLSSGEKRSPRTEAHPNALKNVKNYSNSYFQAMMSGQEGNDSAQFRHSFSVVESRFDPDKLSNIIELNKRLSNRN